MAVITANFEGGTNGNAVLVADAGSATAWNTKVASGASTLTYDSTHAAHGSLAMKSNNGAGSANYMQWGAALGTVTNHYGRFYIYCTANPGSSLYIYEARTGADGLAAGIRLDTGGHLVGMNAVSGPIAGTTTTNAISLNQFVRIEYHIVHSATVGQIEIKLFNTTDSVTPTETVTSAASINLAANAGEVLFGQTQGGPSGYILWYDDIAANATSYPGPAVAATTVSSVQQFIILT